jgi:hypothetical protein
MKIDDDVLNDACADLLRADPDLEKCKDLNDQLGTVPSVQAAIAMAMTMIHLGMMSGPSMLFSFLRSGIEIGIVLGRKEAEVEELERMGRRES